MEVIGGEYPHTLLQYQPVEGLFAFLLNVGEVLLINVHQLQAYH